MKELKLNADMTSVPLGDVLNAYGEFNTIIADQKKEIKRLKNRLYYYQNKERRKAYIKNWKSENKEKQKMYERVYMQTDKYKEKHNARNSEYRKQLKIRHIEDWIHEYNNINEIYHIDIIETGDQNIKKLMLYDLYTYKYWVVRNIYLDKRFTKKDFNDFINDMIHELLNMSEVK